MLRLLAVAATLLGAALAAACDRGEARTQRKEEPSVPAETPKKGAAPQKSATERLATFGGGCFWCVEAIFERVDGVLGAESGYAGGDADSPTYEDVCGGDTGHAEVVQVRYDPAKVRYEQLLEIFWKTHDPTTPNRQGADVGTQYRSAIYTHGEGQRQAAEASLRAYERALAAAGHGKVTTEIAAAPPFYYAEEYHQQYLAKNPGGYCGIGGTGVSCPVPAAAKR